MLNIEDILSIDSEAAFQKAALELFAFQSTECTPYKEYIEGLGISPASIEHYEDIPHLPIELFKNRKIYCASTLPEIIFTSSTTSGDIPAKHYVKQLDDYRNTLLKAFSLFYGAPEEWSFYALLPCYLEREGSSLVWMADQLIQEGGGGFYLDDYDNLLEHMSQDPKPKILLGVTYALLDLAEQYPHAMKDTVIMETGGMKGRREELPKEELHGILCEAFKVARIHSEYGMAELSSQAYSDGKGIFRTPPWMKIAIRDFNDPFDRLANGERGGVNIVDLANIYSCAFIETQDSGVLYPDGSFALSGRMDRTQTRGCNLLVG